MKLFEIRLFRFAVSGGMNTIATFLLYLILVGFTDYHIAFTISFVVGIAIAYTLNSRYVFDVGFSWRSLSRYPAVYLIQYGLGLLLLSVEVGCLGFDKRLAPLINVVVLLPLTFLLNKWFLAGAAK